MLKEGFRKYQRMEHLPDMQDRMWPSKQLERAPVFCSVDLRDGNQALSCPMDLDEKLEMFAELCRMGIKEIEVGFPSSNETEYEILRALIDRDLVPDDVCIQVLTQCREHLIEKTFEAVRGAKNVIVHLYSATSELMRRIVFRTDEEATIALAVKGATLARELAEQAEAQGTHIRFEYSPEHFSATEPEFAVRLCEKVLDAFDASAENPVILNLPVTVELTTPNIFADEVEYLCRNIAGRERAIISVHPHNDRGTSVACAELSLLAGAERIEGTLFGNGERTGNVDIVTLALNMYTLGIDPGIDISDINHIKRVYERCTGMHVHERHPYAGELVFTAFSGSHQDAIKKGFDYMRDNDCEYWQVPYLPISPADIGRQYEPIVRINSQSGKGGAAFVLQNSFGFNLPKGMHPEFGLVVKHAADELHRELSPDEIRGLFEHEYLHADAPYSLKSHKIYDLGHEGRSVTHFEGVISCHNENINIAGEGNGPIDAFFEALSAGGVKDFIFVSYHEHAIGSGSDAKAVAYIELRTIAGRHFYGVGIHNNTSIASIRGVICAINRALKHDAEHSR